ncbi:3'-5' exonuclease [Methylomonas sp. HYX-M1]|uniref:3'-5' exonuclease n=1 Tax=Methylomonas sp. HYX-M1 TaxID=3139307 RepID=UPI00345BF48B
MNDLMIDLETLSLKPNATILTMGAVMFNPISGETGAELHIACCFGQGRDVDIGVVDWWAEPKQAAAKTELVAFLKQNPHRLDFALEKLTRFIKRHRPAQIWGNSPSFDLAILTDAYRQHDMTVPWPFWIERDTRTLVNVCRQLTGVDPKKQIEFDGTAHSALADAIYQARYVSKAFRLITGLEEQ